MIKIYGKGDDISAVLDRSQLDFDAVNDTVADIIKNVRKNGDSALRDYAKKFDSTTLEAIAVSSEEIAEAYGSVSPELLSALRRAKDNILAFHRAQVMDGETIATNGKKVGWVYRAMQRAGIYVPGGTASYPSSVLMTALPAVAAGVKEIYMVTPAKDGKINPLTLVAAAECGVSKVFKVGGAQAIAALAFGTESIPKVDVITGPGNIFVTVAKKQVYGHVGIDMIAGPSEILIIADNSAKSEFLAADLLSQAEHDALSSAVLLTTDKQLALDVQRQVEIQIKQLKRSEIATKSIESYGAIIVVESVDKAIEISNQIAPEHLELCFRGAEGRIKDILNAGAVFIGNYTPEPLGDYYAGANHVLPTSGTAKYFSVLNTQTYMRKMTITEYDKASIMDAADDIIMLAECEGLSAHANAVRVRREKV